MDTDRFARLKEILLTVPRLPDSERAAYLDTACHGDVELRREAESLLSHEPQPRAILKTAPLADLLGNASGVQTTESGSKPLPSRIGPYRILGVLGEGGMGVVYRAEQTEPIRREVAIKIVRRGLSSAQVVARFEAERRALALMEHPNIAAVHDAGADEQGNPYFAMELVRGVPITGFCQTHALAPAERIRLLLPVCRAVQHAHQKGIIHRDLKPSNVLVTEQAGTRVPKVIDFGVAKATEALPGDEAHTREGQILGTPEYMSPEQALGRADSADTRTDVYSLGAILYELLAGRPPFDTKGLSVVEIVRLIAETPPRPLRETWSGDGHPDNDLETIVRKALEKSPERRYAGPGALADDLERYLDSQPILARPASTSYQIRKLVARHRAPFALGGLLLLSLVIFATTMSVLYRRALRAERDRTREAATSERVTDFMLDLFDIADPNQARGPDVTVHEMLDEGAERIATDLSAEPAVQATVMLRLGRVYTNLGLFEKASAMLEGALEKRRQLTGEQSLSVAEAEEMLSWLYYQQENYDNAEALAKASLHTREVLLGPDHVEVAASLDRLASVLHYQRRFDEAEQVARRSLRIRENAGGKSDSLVTTGVHNLAMILKAQEKFDEADVLYRRALALSMEQSGREHPRTAHFMESLANLRNEQGRFDEADSLYQEALSIRETLLGPQHPTLATMMINMGWSAQQAGRPNDARRYYERALEISKAAYGPRHTATGRALYFLGYLDYELGRHAAADSAYRVSREIYEANDYVELVDLLGDYATLRRAQGRPAEAEEMQEQAQKLREQWDAERASPTQ